MAQKTYRIMGELVETNIELIHRIFSLPDMKARLKNDESLFLTNEAVDLHIYESGRTLVGDYDYLVGGFIEGEFETVETKLREMASLLEAENVVYNFEFYEEREPEDAATEEYQIKHPDFRS
jgi:hypothetical protein